MNDKVTIQLKGSSPVEVSGQGPDGLLALKALGVNNLQNLAAVRINGELKDLTTGIDSPAELDPVYLDSPEGLQILRHSTAHVMAEAVRDLFPGVKVTIGPAIEDGFYYDFDFERAFEADDLSAIEKKMATFTSRATSPICAEAPICLQQAK